MGTISVTLPSDNTTADVADINNPINTIVNEINGNLDNANIKAGAGIDGGKIADTTITPSKMKLGSTHAKGYRGSDLSHTGNTWLSITGGTIPAPSITTNGGKITVTMSVLIGVSGGNAEFGVLINGTDYEIKTFPGTSRLPRDGTIIISGIPAGTYTITPRMKASGGGTVTTGAFEDVIISAIEIAS